MQAAAEHPGHIALSTQLCTPFRDPVMTLGLPEREKGKAAATKNPASGEFLLKM